MARGSGNTSIKDYADGGQLEKDAELFGASDFGELNVVVAEPKRVTRTGSTRTPRRAAKLAALQADIAEEIALVGAMASPMSPTFGYVVVEDSGIASEALIKLAQDRPWALKALERAAELGAGAKVGKMVLRWGTAFAVDRDLVAPDALFAQMLKVTPAWIETHPEEVAHAESQGWVRPTETQSRPAPRFNSGS